MSASTLRTPSQSALASRTAAIAVTALFTVNGLMIGGYGGALPSLRVKLDLSYSEVAVLLFCGGAAGILSMQIGGRLADAIGARKVSLGALPLIVAATLAFGFARSFPVAVLGAVLIGLGNGAMDVAMNALGVQVESARHRPIMSFFHAFFSVGNLVGAGSVLIMSTHPRADRRLYRDATDDHAGGRRRCDAGRAAQDHAGGGCSRAHRRRRSHAASPESPGCSRDGVSRSGCPKAPPSTGPHSTSPTVANVDSTTGSLGLVAVSGMMVAIRLVGDRLVARFGRRAVVRFGGACAAAGYLMVTLVSGLPLLIVGWGLVGFGVGMIAPQVYAVAGHIGGGRVLAVVVTFGYAAFLIGPGADRIPGFPARPAPRHDRARRLLCAGIVLLAATMPKSDADLKDG